MQTLPSWYAPIEKINSYAKLYLQVYKQFYEKDTDMTSEFVRDFIENMSITDFGAYMALVAITDDGVFQGKQSEIANLTGMSRERVNVYLNKLSRYGYINLVSSRFASDASTRIELVSR